MAVVIVTSSAPGEGKTGVAAVIARHYAYTGLPVTLARIEGEGAAAEDAAWFASLAFAPGSADAPLDAAPLDPGPGRLLVVEAPLDALASLPEGPVVLVAGGAAPRTLPEGVAAVVLTRAFSRSGVEVEAAPGQTPVIKVGHDRTLAGFDLEELRSLINAEVLVEGDRTDTTCDHLVIAPISSDAGQPYFRRFENPAVVVRFDRTDMHLAAMQGDPACLVLTGGRRPSDYLFDAAAARGVPVFLSRTDTENTVIALEGIFDRTRFHGERKLERLAELLEETPLYDSLGR